MSEARYWPLNWVPDSFHSLPFQAINWKPNNRSEVIEECEVAEILAGWLCNIKLQILK